MWFKAVRQGNIIEPVISATALLSMVCLLSRDQQYLHLTPLCLQWDPLHIIQYTFKIRENPFQGFVLGKFILLSTIMFVKCTRLFHTESRYSSDVLHLFVWNFSPSRQCLETILNVCPHFVYVGRYKSANMWKISSQTTFYKSNKHKKVHIVSPEYIISDYIS